MSGRIEFRPWFGGLSAALLTVLLTLAGCVELPPADPGNGSGSTIVDSGDNGKFNQAQRAVVPEDGQLTINGRISRANDVDVFRLESLDTGDELVIDAQATGSGLDLVAALFDADENIHAFNDDRTPDGSNLNPAFRVVIRGAPGDYFLGVAPYPVNGGTGGYTIRVTVNRAVGVPDPTPQAVYLDWRGGSNIVVANVGTFDLPPFDAASLNPDFSGQTADLKDRVRRAVASRYALFNVLVLSSDDGPPPDGPHSTIYFGGDNARAFAISEQIDMFNRDASDNAIVFTNSFRGAFSTPTSLSQVATAIGNTTAHEIGHLLGLVHTKSCSELMDTTCGNDSILAEQAFGLAPLDGSVFPIGFQNAVELLAWAVGLIDAAP